MLPSTLNHQPSAPKQPRTLAQRLGKSVHISGLDYKLERLRTQFPSTDADFIEDWLVDVANARNLRVVERPRQAGWSFPAPSLADLSNEELAVAICHLGRLDRPQMLRLAAQSISRQILEFRSLRLLAERERVEPVFGELARQALRADPHHDLWQKIATAFPIQSPLRGPILHWTRLAEPVMAHGRFNAESWRLVA